MGKLYGNILILQDFGLGIIEVDSDVAKELKNGLELTTLLIQYMKMDWGITNEETIAQNLYSFSINGREKCEWTAKYLTNNNKIILIQTHGIEDKRKTKVSFI